jgi:hypothetical protein
MGQNAIREKSLALFPLFFDNLVIEGIDTPKCLRADLVQNEYRGRRWRVFTVLGDNERCEGHIVVEWVGKEIFLWRGLLVWVAQKVLEGKGAQFEEVRSDDLEVTRGLGLHWCRWRRGSCPWRAHNRGHGKVTTRFKRKRKRDYM